MATVQGAASAKVKDTLQGFSQKLNPLAQKVSKQLTTVRQWGEEKIGVAQDITELPHEYLELEKHTDALVRVHTALLKVTRTHQTPSYDYPAHLQETIADFSRVVGGKVIAGASGAMRDVAGGDASHQPPPTEASPSPGVAKTLAHALARACNEGAVALGDQEPFGAALRKVAIVEEKIGDAKMKMDQEITKQVYLPLNATLNSTLAHAMRARKNVQSLRLALDACKAQYRTAKPERAEEARLEVEQAEDQFVHAVEEASSVMRACIDSPEPLKDLSDLVVSQLTYCKQAHELLAELAPELDEMHVTQEALYRNTRSE